MGASAWPANVWDGKKGTNKTRHPIVGVGDVVEQMEAVSSVKFSRGEVCAYLPQIGVTLVRPLISEQGAQPTWQVNILKTCVGYRFLPHGLFDTGTVFRVGERPDLVEPGDLLYQIPPQQVLSRS